MRLNGGKKDAAAHLGRAKPVGRYFRSALVRVGPTTPKQLGTASVHSRW
jgi:hypothetical protein